MQQSHIYQARFQWFCGSPATTFARLTLETPPALFQWCGQQMLW
ncbi:hypothetical protein ACXD9I_004612 [Yersinia enterocolitica]|nr:hypothetical protein [Yersinia aleksiciae]